MKKNIYHYCSLETFISILEKKELWISDVLKTNDSSEEKHLEILLHTYLEKIKEKQLNNKEYLEYLEDKQDNKWRKVNKESRKLHLLFLKINKLLIMNNILRYYGKDVEKYICCFSENGDLLSQWRGYADDGRGISLGFYTEKMEELLKEYKNFSLEKVRYISEEKVGKKVIENISQNFPVLDIIENDEELNEIIEDSLKYDDELRSLIDLSFISCSFINKLFIKYFKDQNNLLRDYSLVRIEKFLKIKSSYFSEENEVRIMYIHKINEENEKILSKKLEFRISKGKNDLIKYKRILLEANIINLISHIIIGPKNNININELRMFLENTFPEYKEQIKKIKIEKSKIPYV